MTDNTKINSVLPFMIDSSALSGRVVNLTSVVDDILSRHNYPESVGVLLGQFIVLGTSLANALKYDGIFTFEARGDGLIPLVVVDVSADGSVRGYAQIDDVNTIPEYGFIKDRLVSTLMGTGHMMFTVDQIETKERYQGIVELKGDSLEDCVKEYFEKSAQFQAIFRIACAKLPTGWKASSISIQKLPEESTKYDTETENENWNRATILLKSTKDEELLDENISAEELLMRLYHEDGVRTYPAISLQDKCRCSRERMLQAVMSIPSEERPELLTEQGVVDVNCQYCSTNHSFTANEIGIEKT